MLRLFLVLSSKTLDFRTIFAYSSLHTHNFRVESRTMFDDLFDFAKKRTLKQSIGFFLFHGGLIVGLMSLLKVLGA